MCRHHFPFRSDLIVCHDTVEDNILQNAHARVLGGDHTGDARDRDMSRCLPCRGGQNVKARHEGAEEVPGMEVELGGFSMEEAVAEFHLCPSRGVECLAA